MNRKGARANPAKKSISEHDATLFREDRRHIRAGRASMILFNRCRQPPR